MTQRTFLAVQRHSIFVSFIAVILTLFACSSNNDDDDKERSIYTNSILLNFTSDYTTGELRWMDTESASLSTGALSFGQDSKLSAGGGNIFVLGSYPGTVACVSPEEIGFSSAVAGQQNLGDALNPHEAVVVGGKGYIAINDQDYLQVFNPSTCALGNKIDLPITGANATSIKASGDTLLVILQRLENYSATEPGLLVRINASTETLIDTIQLKLYNPYASVLSNGKIYVSASKYNDPENWDYSIDLEKSGIEVVNLASGTSEILVTGIQLGGGANGIALNEASQTLYASVYVSYGDQPVKPVNVSSKTVGNALPNITDSFGGIVFDDVAKKLFVGERDYGNEGIKIYNPETGLTTVVNDEIANPLPPYSLAIVRW